MPDATIPAVDLPPVAQVSYMVADLDEALPRFEMLFGEFMVIETDNEGSIYKGEPHDARLRVALSTGTAVEIELIQHVWGECPHKDWIGANGESIFHVQFKVDDVDAKLVEMNALGHETVWYNAAMAEHGIKYAYTQAPADQGAHILEFVQGL
jgi:methylmalonyl-CoA/ethylmalonyl-CoA epimerase